MHTLNGALGARSLPLLGHARQRFPPCVASGSAAAAVVEGAQMSLVGLGDAALAQAAVVAGGRATLFQLAFAFMSGALFVATIAAAMILARSYGASNVAKLKAQLQFSWRRTWDMAKTMLSAACMALFRRRLDAGSNCEPYLSEALDGCPVDEEGNPLQLGRWREAWRILRAGFSRTVRTASEGVEALKLQKQLYSAAVGVPGLVTAQIILDKVMPLRLADELEKAFVESLSDVRIGARLFELRSFSVGDASPQLTAARAYDLGDETIGFDVDMAWESNLVASLEAVPDVVSLSAFDASPLGIAKLPISVRNLRFVGPVRVLVTDLMAAPPGYGAILVSLPAPPEISLEVIVAGADVTKVACRLPPSSTRAPPLTQRARPPPHARTLFTTCVAHTSSSHGGVCALCPCVHCVCCCCRCLSSATSSSALCRR